MDFKEKYKQYPYGKEENDRILALTDEEFEQELNRMIELYEETKDEAYEVQHYNLDDIEKAKEKFEYFRKLRKKVKEEYPYGKEENDRILALTDKEFESEAYFETEWVEAAEPMDFADAEKQARQKYDYFRKIRNNSNSKEEKNIEK